MLTLTPPHLRALLQQRALEATEHLKACQLCEHRCGNDRRVDTSGLCHAGTTARVFRHRVEYGEETELVPSHLFYLSGCDLRCKFCIAESNAFNPRSGTPLTADFLQQALAQESDKLATNIQWVGGEPNIHIPAILQAMAEVDELPRITWKSDFYGTPQSLELLDGIVDTFVADLKFGNNVCARKIASVDRYWETVTGNLLSAATRGNLIVRHLILPGHHECCLVPIVRWVAEQMPDVKFSLRDGYLPKWQAKHDPLLRNPVTLPAIREAKRVARSHHLNLIQ